MVIVDFYADWCGPCKYVAPILEEMDAEFDGKVDFIKIDVDDENLESVCADQGIACMPTFIFFKAGSRIHQIEGADVDGIRKFIEENMA